MDEPFKTIFATFADQFPPATSEDYTLKLTSGDLFQTFSRFYSGQFSESDLFELLIDKGYSYAPENNSGSINFYWYLKEKK